MRLLIILFIFFYQTVNAQLYRFYNSSGPYYSKYDYTVLKQNGPSELCKSRLRFKKKFGFFLKCDGKRLFPDQTVLISAVNNEGRKVEMYAAGNAWIHTVREGRINLLSTNTEDFVDWSTHFQKVGDTSVHVLIHKDSCFQLLVNMMTDDARAHKMMRNALRLNKVRRYNFNLSLSCLAFALGTIILHPSVSREDGALNIATNASLAYFVGSFFITTPILMNMPERRRYKALRIYNGWSKSN